MGTELKPMGRVLFGPFEFDCRTGDLRRDGISQKLQRQPGKVLEVLLRRAGEVVTRQEIADQVWGTGTFVDFEQGLNYAIRQIRTALGDDVENPQYLETLPKKGYRFIAMVDQAAPPLEDVPVPSVSPQRHSPRWPLSSKVMWAALAAVLLVAAVLWRSVHRRGESVGSRIDSVAVLPLQNLSHDSEQEYFSEGMTDELITDLAKVEGLRVISHTSVERYKGTKSSLPQVARELGVAAVVEGTVMREGERVRITVQLIEAQTDRHLWAESYERDLRDVLSLQSAVAEDIAGQIKAKLTEDQKARFAQVRAVNPEAFEACFKGRYLWNKRTQADLKLGLEYFQKAVEKDPEYAPAYVGLADSYLSLTDYSVIPARDGYLLAQAATERALQLDPTLAEAYSPRGIIKAEFEWNLRGAEAEFRRGLALNSNDARTHQFYAEEVLEPEGRFQEAESELDAARQLDPSSMMTRAAGGYAYYLGRQYDRAIELEKETIELDPTFPKAHQMLGRTYLQRQMYDEAIEQFQTAARLDGNPAFVSDLAQAYALAGKRVEAERTLKRMMETSAKRRVEPYTFALVYAALGNEAEAMKWLEKCRREHSWLLIYVNVDPRLDRLRGNAQFQELAKAMGIGKE